MLADKVKAPEKRKVQDENKFSQSITILWEWQGGNLLELPADWMPWMTCHFLHFQIVYRADHKSAEFARFVLAVLSPRCLSGLNERH